MWSILSYLWLTWMHEIHQDRIHLKNRFLFFCNGFGPIWENPSEDRIYQTMWSLLHIQLCTVQYTDDRQRDRGFLSFCFCLLPISNILLDCNKSVNFNFEEREAFSKIHKRYTHVLQISGNLVSFCFFSVHLPYHQINFKISHIGWI